jgi:hypothetical protein
MAANDHDHSNDTHHTTDHESPSPSAMDSLFDDLLTRMDEVAAVEGTTDAGTSGQMPEHGPRVRLALPLTMEQVQALFHDVPEGPQDRRAQTWAGFGYGYAGPGGLGSGTDRPWTPEQQATIDSLREVVADMPMELEAWQARNGLPSRMSISPEDEEPWVAMARQTAATLPALRGLPALPTPALPGSEQATNVRTLGQVVEADPSQPAPAAADEA